MNYNFKAKLIVESIIESGDITNGSKEECFKWFVDRVKDDIFEFTNEEQLARESKIKIIKIDEDKEEWIQEHGSDRLNRCLEEDIECHGLYLDERLTKELPEWRPISNVKGSKKEPRNPTIEAFDLLDEARQQIPEAKLAYWVVEHKEMASAVKINKYAWAGYVVVVEKFGREIIYGLPERFHIKHN